MSPYLFVRYAFANGSFEIRPCFFQNLHPLCQAPNTAVILVPRIPTSTYAINYVMKELEQRSTRLKNALFPRLGCTRSMRQLNYHPSRCWTQPQCSNPMHRYMPEETEPAFSLSFLKDGGSPRGKAMPTESPPQHCRGSRARPHPREGHVRQPAPPGPPHPTPRPAPSCTGPRRALPHPTSWFPGGEGPEAGAHLHRPSRRQLLQQLQHFRPSRRRPPAPAPRPATPRVRACTQENALLPAPESAGSRPGPAAVSGCLRDRMCRRVPHEYPAAVTCIAFRQT